MSVHTPQAPLRVALAQREALPGAPTVNIQRAVEAIRDAASAGARLIVFPELFLTGYVPELLARDRSLWFEETDTRFAPLRDACASSKMTAVLGAPLRVPGGCAIAAPVFGSGGDVCISLKEYLHESEVAIFVPGLPAEPFDVDGWKVSVAICFDTAHPAHAERAARAGAHAYVSSSLYQPGEERRCDLHHGARAMDNGMFALLANYSDVCKGTRSCGVSGAWNPQGVPVMRAAGAVEALVVADLDPKKLRKR